MVAIDNSEVSTRDKERVLGIVLLTAITGGRCNTRGEWEWCHSTKALILGCSTGE
jgi:hypothetical protein